MLLWKFSGRIGKEIVENFFQSAQNAGERIHGEFAKLNTELNVTNDELILGNDKLQNELDKLAGKPENGIKIAIDEALLSADQLIDKLDTALGKLDEFLKKNQLTGITGTLKAFFTGEAPTPKDLSAEELSGKTAGGPTKDIRDIQERGREQIANQQKIAAAATDAASKKAALDEANTIREGTLILLEQKYGEEIQKRAKIEQQAAEAQAQINLNKLRVQDPLRDPRIPIPEAPSQERNVELAGASATLLKKQLEEARNEFAKVGLEQKVAVAKAGKDAAEEAKKAAAEWLKVQKDLLEDTKANHATSAAEELEFWTVRLPEAQKKYPTVVRSVQQEILAARAKSLEELKKANEDDLKAFEEHIKEVRAAASEAQQSPASAELQVRQQAIAQPEQFGLRPEAAEQVAKPVPGLGVEADKAQLESLKKQIGEIDKAWELSGEHSAEQVAKNAQEWLVFLDSMRGQWKDAAGNVTGFGNAIGSVIQEWQLKFEAAAKKAQEEARKLAEGLGNIQLKGAIQTQTSDLDQKELAIEQAYALTTVRTYQDQIAYESALADIQTKKLELKLAEAEITRDDALQDAIDLGTVETLLKYSEDQLKVDEARNALALQRQQAANATATVTRKDSFTGQITAGIDDSFSTASNQLVKALTDLATQSKGWGKEFDRALKEGEKGIVSAIIGAGEKQVLNAGKAVLQSTLGNSSGGGILGTVGNKVGGALFGAGKDAAAITATTANTTALTALNVHLLAVATALGVNTGTTAADVSATTTNAAVTGTHAGIMSAHLGVMTAHLAVMFTHLGVMIANTIATIGNTIATIAEAIAGFFHFAAGGRPEPGVPALVGEKGMELFIPDTAGTIIPADKTKAMLAQLNAPVPVLPPHAVQAPEVPSVTSPSHEQQMALGSGTGIVSNQNTGRVGDTHYNIYNANNPREVMRQIADFEKRQTGQYSPANS